MGVSRRLIRGRPSITPLKGGSLEEYRRRLGHRYWPGFADDFLSDAGTTALSELAQRTNYRRRGLRTRQRLQQIYAELTLGAKKPNPRFRNDITETRLRAAAETCHSARAVAVELKTNPASVKWRADSWGIKVPNPRLDQRIRAKRLAPRIKALRQKGWTISHIAKKVGVDPATIGAWNRKYKLWPRSGERN